MAEIGRPSKYDPAYCEGVIEHCSTGASLTSYAATIDVCRDTLTEWAAKHEDFSLAVKKAKAKCAYWWENQARIGAEGKGKQNPTLCIFGLKNMAPDDWCDRVETKHSGEITTKVTRELVRPYNTDS